MKKLIVILAFLISQIPIVVSSQNNPVKPVLSIDCGAEGHESFLVKGENYTFPEALTTQEKLKTCTFGRTIVFAFNQMNIQADYRLEISYFSDGHRKQKIAADGNTIQEPYILKTAEELKQTIDLPKKSYAYGQLILIFECLEGPNAVVSGLTLYSSDPVPPVPFSEDKKTAIRSNSVFPVDTTVDVSRVLPQYTQIPQSVPGIYQPVKSLNGTWAFHPNPEKEFWKQNLNTDKWKQITVPGEWSMQGFSVDSAAFAGYEKRFTLPDDWKNNRIKLRFSGVQSEAIVFLNGIEIGKHSGGMTAFELDITRALKPAENKLSLLVQSESTADMLGSITQYAAHQTGGITRDVALFAVPDLHISDLRIETDLDSNYQHARLKVYTAITNSSDNEIRNATVKIRLDGYLSVFQKTIPPLKSGETWKGWIEENIESPLKWDNEHPHLYSLNIELQNRNETIEQVTKRIGFREIETIGNQIFVNGKAVKLRGVCRHEAHPLTGRVLTTELRRQDAILYRNANCNFIRTSHYPPDEAFLDLCDELGLFVEVEAPVCWVGHHANENWTKLDYQDKKYYPYILQVNMETIQLNRNHPSVLFWSMANESYWNKEFAQILVYMKKADPTRPIAFHDQAYGGFNNQGSSAPIANIHYPGPEGYKVAAQSKRPMLYGEYCHLNVYNRSELVTDPGIRSDWALALAPAWENMYKTPGVLGGSIWSGIDDIFQLPDNNAVGYGAWGPVDGWRRPKPEYWDMKKIYSPVRVTTQTLDSGNQFKIEVENRYTFTNLNELKIEWQYGNERGIAKTNVPAGQQGVVTIRIEKPEKSGALHLSFIDPKGFMTDEYRIPVGEQPQNTRANLPPLPTKLKQGKDKYTLTGDRFYCEIDRHTGRLITFGKDKKAVVSGGPYLMALPLTGGGCYPNHNTKTPVFNDICSDWQLKQISAREKNGSVIIEVSGSYSEFEGNYSFVINANGECTTNYAFKALKEINPRQWGLVFETPDTFQKTFWLREGLWNVYPNDHISRTQGEAPLFYAGIPDSVNPRVQPSWSWSMDYNQLGSNDFRATRRNIWHAGLKDDQERKVVVYSDGKQHWRSWKEQNKIRFLVADFVTGGNEMFLNSYYAPYRKPLKTGDLIKGSITFRIE